MRARLIALVAGSLLLSGCYRVTVVSGNAPSPTVVDKQWQLSFVMGLIPPPALDVRSECPNGVQKVVTETSFLNAVVASLTNNLVTPVRATVTCAR